MPEKNKQQNSQTSITDLQPIQAAIRSTLVENEGLLCLMAE